MTADKGILLLFLGANAVQDLRRKEILPVPAVLYGFISLWQFFVSGETWENFFLSCIPGVLLLVLALCSSGQVGMGDGWILLITGLHLGLFSTLGILWIAACGMAAAALCICAVRRKKLQEKTVLPMVPFFFAAALLWLSVQC